jgi:hypothetical protein
VRVAWASALHKRLDLRFGSVRDLNGTAVLNSAPTDLGAVKPPGHRLP